MRVAIVDLETTTPDPQTAAIVEIACCVWSADRRTVESAFSTLVRASDNPAEAVNGISPAALVEATPLDRALVTVGHFVGRADVIAAHNGDAFDRPILERHTCPWVATKPWIDTMDLDLPRPSSSRALVQLAVAHQVPIGTVHRAIDDVLLVARLLERAGELGHDIEASIAKALRPRARFVADVPRSRNDELKASGFRWDRDRKEWWKRMAIEDASTLPFDVREVAD